MQRSIARRELLQFLAASPLLGALSLPGCGGTRRGHHASDHADHEGNVPRPRNIFELEELARGRMTAAAYDYAAGGADDELTLLANREGFRELQLRCRRLVDVSAVDTRLELFGQPLAYPIALAPVGFQGLFHADAELETARGAAAADALLIASSVSTRAVGEIAAARGAPVWFQLYPTPDRAKTQVLLERAEAAGSPVVVLTVDTPVLGNRERHSEQLADMIASAPMGNYAGMRDVGTITDASMTWDMLGWLREHCGMRIVVKGIVTREDARRCVEHGADGLVVSNHGGRQEESGRGTIECLPEVVEAVGGALPVLIDGGIRRGTDVLKALALGADAVCIGRPYVWGLCALGSEGVTLALEILRSELVLAMQLAGAPSLAALDASFVQRGG